MNKTKISLLLIFLVTTTIPVIYVYLEHATVEVNAYEKATTETKKIKTLSEALLFAGIGFGYVISIGAILYFPKSPIPYLVVIIGTIAVVILYYLRIYGIPIPGTEIVIVDFSSDWRDVVTKIFQQILVVPATALLFLRSRGRDTT